MNNKSPFDDLTIINLDDTPSSSENSAQSDETIDTTPDTSNDTAALPSKKFKLHTILHIATFLLVIGGILFVISRFANFGEYVDQSEIFRDGLGEHEDTMDLMLPVDDSILAEHEDDGITTIVAFGNSPFADDRDSENGLAGIIQDKTGAVIYNCSIKESYLASHEYMPDEYPMDAYTFYWLACLASGITDRTVFDKAAAALGEDAPENIDTILDTITSIDYNKVDVITVMYDAQDYFMGNYIYDISYHKNLTAFNGNLVAGLEVLQNTYPHIRIIVMSPTYAFAVNEDGEYVSSDQYLYNPNESVLSTYCIYQGDMCAEMSVTFVDHIYGTITEDNAREYLKDNVHLNQKGREAVADRFIYALNFFND